MHAPIANADCYGLEPQLGESEPECELRMSPFKTPQIVPYFVQQARLQVALQEEILLLAVAAMLFVKLRSCVVGIVLDCSALASSPPSGCWHSS